MNDLAARVTDLKRPKLLSQAARIGAKDYNRATVLPRLLGYRRALSPTQAITLLLELEAEMEEARLEGRADYRLTDQVEMLIALVGELRLLKATHPDLRRVSRTTSGPVTFLRAAAAPQL